MSLLLSTLRTDVLASHQSSRTALIHDVDDHCHQQRQQQQRCVRRPERNWIQRERSIMLRPDFVHADSNVGTFMTPIDPSDRPTT